MTTDVPPERRGMGEDLGRRTRTVVLAAIMLAMLLSSLDQTIVATALPAIVGDLGGGTHLSWVVTAYLLAETIVTVVIGKFGDLFGRKSMFLVSVSLFLIGSFFAGWSGSLGMLVAFRAVQGLGGGGLMVTATALIADVVPLRERAKFQGLVGAVFGVSTVAGPLLGGLFVDHLGWRWAFYVNIPLGILVLVVASAALPTVATPHRPRIDYAGIVLIALAATGMTLVTSWGGNEYPWGSPLIIGMAVASVLLLVAFVVVERHAAEPMLPMRLFRTRVFTVSGILSFVVGFAMLGGITYLPTYLQYVRGESATASGLWMLPLIGMLMVAAVLSGNVIGKTGHYRSFPIAGTVVMTVGMLLLSRLTEHTSYWIMAGDMVVLGAGIGLIMQVPMIVVQSTANYDDLGVATSGVSFLRAMGSSFGVALFGTIYAGALPRNLASALANHPLPAGVDPQVIHSPVGLHALPRAVAEPIIAAYADTVQAVFLFAAPIAVVAFFVALLLPQVQLRGTSRAAVSGGNAIGEGFAPPASSNSDQALEKLIATVVVRLKEDPTPSVLAHSGSGVTPAQAWLLTEIYRAATSDAGATISEVGTRHCIPAGIVEPTAREMVGAGYLDEVDGRFRFTRAGAETFAHLVTAWRNWFLDQLRDWHGEEHEKLTADIDALTARMIVGGRALSAR